MLTILGWERKRKEDRRSNAVRAMADLPLRHTLAYVLVNIQGFGETGGEFAMQNQEAAGWRARDKNEPNWADGPLCASNPK